MERYEKTRWVVGALVKASRTVDLVPGGARIEI